LKANFQQIVKKSFDASGTSFIELVEEAIQLLGRESGKIGNMEVTGKLVKSKPIGEALVIGDLHGDLERLVDILQTSDYLRKMSQDRSSVLFFLGDYGDRGPFSAEVYYTVLNLKLLFPDQTILLRGNHEGPDDIMAEPHDLPAQFEMKFGRDGSKAYSSIKKLFPHLYNAAVVEGQYLLVHGGLPHKICSIEDLSNVHELHSRESLLEELLWSDPTEMTDKTCASPRGAGRLFGQKVTDEVLSRLGVKIMVRGHEPCQEGFKLDHNSKILTLFSRKGPPYFNDHGAYLRIDLSKRIRNAEELIPFIHKF